METQVATAVDLGLIVSPALEPSLAVGAREDALQHLGERYGNVSWTVELVRDRLVEPPVHLTELVDATRSRLLAEGWDLAICVTELPLRLQRRPLVTHASPTHGVALISLPALGVLQRRRRLREAVAGVTATLLGEFSDSNGDVTAAVRRRRLERRLSELAAELDDEAQDGVVFLARVISGNLSLLVGMVRANRPWRLIGHLSRAAFAALAAAVFAVVTSDVGRISASLDAVRMTVLMLGSIAAAVTTLILVHDLWERAPGPRAREQVMLFNLATLATVVFGIGSLYLAVFLASLAGAGLLIDSSLFAKQVGRGVGLEQYLALAWLTSTLATASGALGAVLETGAAVREAAYAYRPDPDDEAP